MEFIIGEEDFLIEQLTLIFSWINDKIASPTTICSHALCVELSWGMKQYNADPCGIYLTCKINFRLDNVPFKNNLNKGTRNPTFQDEAKVLRDLQV